MPDFIEIDEVETSNQTTRGRELIKLNELDVGRDLISFTFILRSDVELSQLEYFLEIKNWT